MKFSGTSVGSAEHMHGVVRLVDRALAESRVLVVASAVAEVTNLLLDAAQTTADLRETEATSERFRKVQQTVFEEFAGASATRPTSTPGCR